MNKQEYDALLASCRCSSTKPVKADIAQALLVFLLEVPAYSKAIAKLKALHCYRVAYARANVKQFVLELQDGTRIPVAKGKLWQSQIAKKPLSDARIAKQALSSQRNAVLCAMRLLIQPQMDNFKNMLRKRLAELIVASSDAQVDSTTRASARSEVRRLSTCALTGKPLASCAGVHIDHVIPFSFLVESWLAEQGITELAKLKLCGRGSHKVFKDDALNQSWQEYHAKYAKLTMVSAKANLSKGNRAPLQAA